MAIIVDLHHHLLLSVFGILGNIFSVFVFLAPVSTFIEIYRARSTMDFDSLPFILALLSCKLWMYYGFIQENATLLIIIGSIGVVVETTYILIFLVFATNQVRCQTLKEFFLCIGGFYLIFAVSWFLLSDEIRVSFVGWISVAISVAHFASPIGIVECGVLENLYVFLPRFERNHVAWLWLYVERYVYREEDMPSLIAERGETTDVTVPLTSSASAQRKEVCRHVARCLAPPEYVATVAIWSMSNVEAAAALAPSHVAGNREGRE
nr:bidirectional sugar transporter N3-like [Ipomoea batatas]